MSNHQSSSAAAAVEAAKVQDPEKVRVSVRSEIYGVSDSVHKLAQDLDSKQFDEMAEYTLAQFLYTVIPVFLLKDLGLLEIADNLAEKHNLQNRLEVERG